MAARVCFCVAVMMCNFSLAASFYVSTTGNNAWPGTAAQPWRTLQYAAEEVGAGDSVTVRPGNYAGFHLETSGTAAAPISFLAEPGVLINAPKPVRTQHGINLENASYVVVDGFEVTGMPRAGVRSVGVDGDTFASHVTIRNVHSHHNGYWGILTGFVDDVLIENNETNNSTTEHGIYVSNSGDRPIIRNNLSYNNRANGIHMNGDASLGGDGIISNANVSGNVIHGNGAGGGSGINMDGVQNSRIENNLLYNNQASGISLYRIDGGDGSTGNVVVNNTIYQASNGRWAVNIRDGSTGNTLRNNILLHAGSRGAISIWDDSLEGFTSDYNAVKDRFTTTDGDSTLTLAQWRTSTGQDLHSLIATPTQLFANLAGNDYHLASTSPAIDAGTAFQAPAFDLDGQQRPIGAAFDIGAFEWAAALAPGDFNDDGNVNAADYVALQKLFGSTAAYQQWRQNFGEAGSGGGSPAPEPATGAILSIAIMMGLCCQRDCHHKVFGRGCVTT
jgi:hypothetical protein